MCYFRILKPAWLLGFRGFCQWGRVSDSTEVGLQIDFSDNKYAPLIIHWGTATDAPTAIRVDLNTKSSFTYVIQTRVSPYGVWIAIGY